MLRFSALLPGRVHSEGRREGAAGEEADDDCSGAKVRLHQALEDPFV